MCNSILSVILLKPKWNEMRSRSKCKNRFYIYLRQKSVDLCQTKTKMIICPFYIKGSVFEYISPCRDKHNASFLWFCQSVCHIVMRMVGGSSRCRYLWPGVFAYRQQSNYVLLTWPRYQRAVRYVTKYRDKKYSWSISTYHVVNPRGLVFLDGGDAC